MNRIAGTPKPPYYAVIFTSQRTEGDNGYAEMAASMEALAARQPGFLGFESAQGGVGLSVSYWESLAWKDHPAHRQAQAAGRSLWYAAYKVRISRVERDYPEQDQA